MTEQDNSVRPPCCRQSTSGPQYVQLAPPTGWSAMARTVRELDEDKIRDCKEDIDTLLVFAGLYSAVLSTFLIQTYQNLQPDPNVQMLYLLERIAVQTQSYTIASGTVTSAAQPPTQPDQSTVPLWALRVNGLWFASLIVSLATASLSMLVKQWLREYLAVEYTAPQERLRARQYRRPGLDSWKVFEIAAILPMLLQVSLGLFFVGLCFFTANVDDRMGLTSVPLVCGWAFFVVATTFAPLLSPRCPYKMPLLKSVMRAARVHVMRKPRRWVSLLMRAVASRSQHLHFKPLTMDAAEEGKSPAVKARAAAAAALPKLPDGDEKPGLSTDDDEEEKVVTRDQDDKDILLSSDRIMGDDILLMTMWDTFRQRTYDPAESLSFIVELMLNRVGETQYSYLRDKKLTHIPDLSQMSRRAWLTFMEMLAKLVGPQPSPLLESSHDWLHKATLLLLSKSPYPLPHPALLCLRRLLPAGPSFPAVRSIALWLGPELESAFGPLFQRLHQLYEHGDHNVLLRTLWDVLKQRRHDPSKSLSFIVELIINHIGTKAEYLRADQLSCVPDLTSLSTQLWSTLMEILAELADTRSEQGYLLETSPGWLKKTTLLLLSNSLGTLPDSAVTCLRSLLLDAPGLSAVKPISRWIAKESPMPASAIRSLFHQVRELYKKHGDKDDQDTLPLIDAIMANDGFLPHTWTSSDSAMQISYKQSSLPSVVNFVVSRLGEGSEDLIAVRLCRIPELSSLSRRTWDTIMDILADLASCRHANGTLQSFQPDWLQKVAILLLSSSPHPLPASAVSCLRDIFSEATQRDIARWAAHWLSSGLGKQRLDFQPLSNRLCSIYEGQCGSKASLLMVYYLYAHFLRPSCKTGSPCEMESLRAIMIREPGLFIQAAARPILDDAWSLICSALLAQRKTSGEVIFGASDGLAIIVEFGERLGRRSDTVAILSALWENRTFSYMVLIHASTALHAVTSTSWAYSLQLGTDAFKASSAQAKLLEQSIQIASQFKSGVYDKYIPMDLVRFCFLHVKLYEEHAKQSRLDPTAPPQPPSTNDAAPSTVRHEPLAWRKLWIATNTALREYHRKKGWEATYNGSHGSQLSSAALLTEDRKLAGSCLKLMESLEHPSLQAGKPEEPTKGSVFPEMLVIALGLFIAPEDVSGYPSLVAIREQQRQAAHQPDVTSSPSKGARILGLPVVLLPRPSSPPGRPAGASPEDNITARPGHDSGVAEELGKDVDIEAQNQTVDAREGAAPESPSATDSPWTAFPRALTFRSARSTRSG